eukprot:gene3124-2106_t
MWSQHTAAKSPLKAHSQQLKSINMSKANQKCKCTLEIHAANHHRHLLQTAKPRTIRINHQHITLWGPKQLTNNPEATKNPRKSHTKNMLTTLPKSLAQGTPVISQCSRKRITPGVQTQTYKSPAKNLQLTQHIQTRNLAHKPRTTVLVHKECKLSEYLRSKHPNSLNQNPSATYLLQAAHLTRKPHRLNKYPTLHFTNPSKQSHRGKCPPQHLYHNKSPQREGPTYNA